MRNRGDIADKRDFQSGSSQSTQRRFTAAAGAFHQNSHIAQAMLHGLGGSISSRDLSRKGSGLARAAEAARAGSGPRNDISGDIRNCDNRVIKRALNMNNTIQNVLLQISYQRRRHSNPHSQDNLRHRNR